MPDWIVGSGNEGRVAAALVLLAAYLVCGLMQYHRFHGATRMPLARTSLPPAASTVWLIYASQTGQAEAIARQTMQVLREAGCLVQLARLDEPWMARAAGARCLLFVVSTHGDGGAPDHAWGFVRKLGQEVPQGALCNLAYGVLALGDRTYPQFCAFGRALDGWLAKSGAQPLFPRIESDRLDADSLARWSHALGSIHGKMPLASFPGAARLSEELAFAPWRFIRRSLLNPGSAGHAMYKIELRPAKNVLPDWQAGDLADVQLPEEPLHPRTYSIANLPGEGRIELIVRTRLYDDGKRGLASGFFNETAQPDDTILLRVRRNAGFRSNVGTNTPLILIGAGAGLAGLRSHLMARAQALTSAGLSPPECCAWLIFGERSSVYDRLCHEEFANWQHKGVLSRADFTFSRDNAEQPYVQDVLKTNSMEVRRWVDAGANFLICGAAKTMARGVDETLRCILGEAHVDVMLEAGRIRRDVF